MITAKNPKTIRGAAALSIRQEGRERLCRTLVPRLELAINDVHLPLTRLASLASQKLTPASLLFPVFYLPEIGRRLLVLYVCFPSLVCRLVLQDGIHERLIGNLEATHIVVS